nr:MAG TPA: hypothetical protein [Caudoviricetes sp.]
MYHPTPSRQIGLVPIFYLVPQGDTRGCEFAGKLESRGEKNILPHLAIKLETKEKAPR